MQVQLTALVYTSEQRKTILRKKINFKKVFNFRIKFSFPVCNNLYLPFGKKVLYYCFP